MKPSPLIEAEFDRLSAILERLGDKRSMNLEQLDGFLTAWICGPEIVPPTPRDTERPAQPSRRPDPPVLRNKTELHVDSFAK
jgi:hypothetical protein